MAQGMGALGLRRWVMRAAIRLLGLAGIAAGAFGALAANDRVAFPEGYAMGVHYTTVERGGITERIFTSPEAIAAARRGEPLPDGTVITMEDHRDGRLFRYVVMQKRAGWGDAYPADRRSGDWEFREFRPDRTASTAEDGSRCMACHRSRASQDFVFTYQQMAAKAQ